VRKLATPNEKVIIQPPVYNIFYNSIRNNGCRVLESPLVYENGGYCMDLKDLEEKMSDPQASLMFLCNPHNPVGKLWDRETLKRIGEMAAEHHIIVVSDEIHCDITAPGKEYVTFASASDTCRDVSITCMAPTKAFNIAGLQTSAVMIPDPYLRHRIWRALNTDEVAEPNCLAQTVTMAAFNESGDWLDEMREYVFANRAFAENYLKRELPDIGVVKADATYLMWIDISILGTPSDKAQDIIRKETGLFVSDGLEYGEAGRYFLRMNLACPGRTLEDGLGRLKKGLDIIRSRKGSGIEPN
jgi:cystathionine beta-lyase